MRKAQSHTAPRISRLAKYPLVYIANTLLFSVSGSDWSPAAHVLTATLGNPNPFSFQVVTDVSPWNPLASSAVALSLL